MLVNGYPVLVIPAMEAPLLVPGDALEPGDPIRDEGGRPIQDEQGRVIYGD